MSDVRVRRLGLEEGLLAAALHVQSLRAAGHSAPPGHLDRFASGWVRDWASLPTWVAEHEGAHAGVVMVQVPLGLPAALLPPQWARVVLLYAVPSAPPERTVLALLRVAADWVAADWVAGDEAASAGGGAPGLELADGLQVPPAALDALGARVDQRRRVRVPARR